MGDNYPAQLVKFIDETIPDYFAKYEEQVEKNGGFFVGGKLSFVDFFFVTVVEYLKWWIVYSNKKDKEEILTGYPNLTALNQKVFNLEGVKKWIAERPEETITEFP